MTDLELKARAVSSAIFECLNLALNNPDQADRWDKQADKLERKFTNEHGKHYSYFLGVR